jgi:UDP-glucose 4-epimerase
MRFFYGSILEKDFLEKVFKEFKIDGVIHLAARGSVPKSMEDPAETMKINIVGTQNVIMAARGCEFFLNASSSSVYGGSKFRNLEEYQALQPASPYAISKKVAEEIVRNHRVFFSDTMKVSNLRFFNVYGPNQPRNGAIIPEAVSAALRRTTLTIHGSGEQARDFTYVNDLCALIEEMISIKRFPEVLNVCGGQATTINAAVMTVFEVLAAMGRVPITEQDKFLASIERVAPRHNDVDRSCGSIEERRKKYNTEFKSLRQGLTDWFMGVGVP